MTNQLVQLKILPSVLLDMLRGHPLSEVTSDLPPDAVIVDTTWDFDDGCIYIKLWSSTFAYVMEGSVIPHWVPTYQSWEPTELLKLNSAEKAHVST